MDCPFCGRKMGKGALRSRGSNFFQRRERSCLGGTPRSIWKKRGRSHCRPARIRAETGLRLTSVKYAEKS